MFKMISRRAGKVALLVCLFPAWALGQTVPVEATPGPAGTWKGPLSTPGGNIPIQFDIVQPSANKLLATLDLPSRRLNRIPASLARRGDTLVFYAASVDCRFVCVQAGDELRGTWAQPGLRVPLVLRRYVQGAADVTTSVKAASVTATYHTEQVTITSQPGNVKLAGTLSIPDGAGPFPAAILLSDMGAQDRDETQGSYRFFAALASSLARQGIAILRLDDRGVGKSEGNSSQTTTTDRVRDAQAGLSYLRVRSSIDAARTGLIGHGEGGNVALLAAAGPVPPAFVVSMAAAGVVGLDLLAGQPEPVTNPADTARAGAARRQAWADVLAKAAKLRTSGSNAAQVETYIDQQRLKIKSEDRKQVAGTLKFRRSMLEIVRQNPSDDQAQAIVVNMLRQRYPTLDPALARARATELTSPWYRNYLKFDPQLSLAAVQCPVLLLNGTEDAEVNVNTNLTALEKGLKANKRVTVRRLPGVNHWFQTPASEMIAGPDGKVDPVMAPVLFETVKDWVLQEAGK